MGEQVLISALGQDEPVALGVLNHLTLPLSMLISLCKGLQRWSIIHYDPASDLGHDGCGTPDTL
ncbi:Uncharacterised protein [Pseudomonas aeruginosa]|nr:Uncharacterised protein [Pseudomonas aeruginosa]